ncbi:fasciclin domain-containing protein [Bacillus tamaricis]|uniref:Fasciclin domain-containing protein n=1 Tax=Evansella tamaricis TaxID=2069301 RepID=A0ABS6JGY2_9BACI|nr:fasciclin domain-containing protein [Evansella tamaricis]
MFTVSSEAVKVNDSNIIDADIEASNGVIHVIDAVLLPVDDEEKPENPKTGSNSVALYGILLFVAGAGVYVTRRKLVKA